LGLYFGVGKEIHGLAKNILVIDDDATILDAMRAIFAELGYRVAVHSDSSAGLADALSNSYDLVIVDLRMPGKSGADVAEELLKSRPETRLLVITAYPDDPLAARALVAGAVGLLKKPFEIAKILDYLRD
jgi:FixJ family two-component response regulator